MSEAFLITVANDMEANIIESKLRQFEIPILKKYKGFGMMLKVIAGSANNGIDIYVPEKALELSKSIIFDEGEDIDVL